MNTRTLIGICAALALGCGGVSGGSTSGDVAEATISAGTASDFATRLAAHMTDSTGVPCEVYAPGQTGKYGDFSFEVGPPRLIEPVRDGTSDERRVWSNKKLKGLLVPFRMRNDAPVQQKPDVIVQLYTASGESVSHQANATEEAAKKEGVFYSWLWPKLAPDQWKDSIWVFPVDPADTGKGAIYLKHLEYERDARGRKIKVIRTHIVLDLAAVQPAAE